MSLPRHDEPYTSTPWQLAVELSKHNSVCFIDHPFTLVEAFLKIRNKQIRKRLSSYLSKPFENREGVTIIYPPFTLPLNFLPKGKLYDLVLMINQLIVARRLNQVFGKEGYKNLWYINSFNFYFPTLSDYFLAKPACEVYHCIDPMVKSYTLKHGVRLQYSSAKHADLIIATANSLCKQFNAVGFPPCYYVPNAANFSLFSKTQNIKLRIHPVLNYIKGNVMGYFGNIERRIDEDLLLQVLEKLPDWQLVMAGPLDKSYFKHTFLTHPRICFVGSFTHDEAPSVIKRFDVAVIPFKCDEVSSGIYPLKLFEYLAAGKPVISTNFNPELLTELTGNVYIANNSNEFTNHVHQSMHGTPQSVARRTNLAWENSWEVRTKQFEQAIYRHYHETKGINKE